MNLNKFMLKKIYHNSHYDMCTVSLFASLTSSCLLLAFIEQRKDNKTSERHENIDKYEMLEV